MRVSPPLLALLATTAACNFDEAFQRYCENNPQCPKQDAAPDLASEPDSSTTPDLPDKPDLPEKPDLPGEPGLPSWPDTASMPPRDAAPGDKLPPSVPNSCGTSNDCAPNEYCHPINHVCMIACSTRADCPEYLDTCAEIQGERRLRVCICTNNRSCANFGFVCHLTDNLCEPDCSTTEDYCYYTFQPPRVCDPSGMCQLPCRGNWDCRSPNQPRCDLTSQLCIKCVDVTDCSGRPDGLTQCDDQTGACVRPSP
jgi:hypothetical protein